MMMQEETSQASQIVTPVLLLTALLMHGRIWMEIPTRLLTRFPKFLAEQPCGILQDKPLRAKALQTSLLAWDMDSREMEAY